MDTILVPLDGSRLAKRALPVASELARRLGAGLHLLSAVPTEDDRISRVAQLDAVRRRGLTVHRSVVVSRDPAGVIHEKLRRLGRAVACMASHGRGRSAALVGSVATDVVARGHDPLVLVGPVGRYWLRPPERRWGYRDWEEPFDGHGVVASVDGTSASVGLVPTALRWANLLKEPFLVLTVAEERPEPVRPGPVRRSFGPAGDVDAYLEALVRPIRDDGHKVDTLAWYDPISPAKGLQAYLWDNPACLVVVASHARSGPTRVVFGSVAAAVVRYGRSPVLVVPQPTLFASQGGRDAGSRVPRPRPQGVGRSSRTGDHR
ncbi:MAG: universal stress protein [Actinomycetota bacterium]